MQRNASRTEKQQRSDMELPERLASLDIMGTNWKPLWIPLDYNSIIILRVLRKFLNRAPIVPRDASLSNNGYDFIQSGTAEQHGNFRPKHSESFGANAVDFCVFDQKYRCRQRVLIYIIIYLFMCINNIHQVYCLLSYRCVNNLHIN